MTLQRSAVTADAALGAERCSSWILLASWLRCTNSKGEKDGEYSWAGVIRDARGNLYGTTFGGGSGKSCTWYGEGGACGTVFKLDNSGKETVLHRFSGGKDGATPEAGLVEDAAGNLYGTATAGGTNFKLCYNYGCGTLFKIDISGRFTVLYSFTGRKDGREPLAGLIEDARGNLYGTTPLGGDLSCAGYQGTGCGTVFKVDKTGKFTVLHSFTGERTELKATEACTETRVATSMAQLHKAELTVRERFSS